MEIKNLPGGISDDLLTYMHITSDFLLQEFVVFSESVCDVQKMMNDGHCEIHLFGPKGCGKSYTAAVLFLMLQDRKPCLYLTQRSFTYPNYFLAFLNQHQEVFTTQRTYQSLQNKLSTCEDVKLSIVVQMIQSVLNTGNQLYLFIDFGRIRSYSDDGKYLECLLAISNIHNSTPRLLTKIFSVSCGLSVAMTNTMFSYQLRDLCLQLEHRVNQCFSRKIITGFTDTEANDVISLINKAEIDVNQVKKLAGTNPLLLSHLKGATDLSCYSRRVKGEIESFIQNNLSVVRNPETISDFFAFYKWNTGRLYIHLALQGKKFTPDQYENYKGTWLYDNHLLIDKGDNTMKFNFPGMGEALVQLLRTSVPKIPGVQELAAINPSVGGFVFEKVFIDHVQRNSRLVVTINNLLAQANSTENVNFSVVEVLPFEGCNLLKNTLYELYSCHPAIDFVGYLEGASADYLVFIQLSLSKYADHRAKLGDVLSNCPKKDHLSEGEPSNLNLLQFYSGRASDHYERNDNPNVVLLYISPKEDQGLIQTLQDQLKLTFSHYLGSFNIFVGVAPQSSPFFVGFRSTQ